VPSPAALPAHFTILEAAEQLRVSRTWLDAFLKDKPYCYRKAGNRKRFTAADIALISEKMRCHSTLTRRVRNAARTTASGEHTSGSALNEALELAGIDVWDSCCD
jgi:hypothetical protein